MTEVLISIKPKYVKLILDGKKTIELRKSKPKIDTPFIVHIYESKNRRKIVGHFICDKIYQYSTSNIGGQTISKAEIVKRSCLSNLEIDTYENSEPPRDFCCYRVGVFGWNITNLEIYDTPLSLDCFNVIDNKAIKNCVNRERIYNNPDYTNGALLKGGYLCNLKNDWCNKCKRKALNRAPQSWCYVKRNEV